MKHISNGLGLTLEMDPKTTKRMKGARTSRLGFLTTIANSSFGLEIALLKINILELVPRSKNDSSRSLAALRDYYLSSPSKIMAI